MKYPIVLAVLMICFISFPADAQLAEATWPMFHYDLDHTGSSTGYMPDTSAVNWTFSTGERIFGSAAIGDDDMIYIGTRKSSSTWGSKLYAIYPNGTEKWHWSPDHAVDFIDSTPTIASDGTIYIGSWDRNLYALYPNSTMKWKFYAPIGGFVLTSPAIAPDGTIYIGNKNNNLYAINSNGSLKWIFETGKNIESSPAVGHDGTIYVGSLDRKLYAIYPDGILKWSYTTGDKIKSSPVIGEDGTVYVGSNDAKLYAIHSNGMLRWSYTTGDRVISSPAIDANGMVYVGSNDGILYAIYPNSTLRWSYPIGDCIISSPAIDADGTVCVGSFDGYVYTINPSGTLLWKYDTGNKIYYSSPTIASDGMVYIGNWGGDLYAFGPGTLPNRPPVLDIVGNKTVNENSLLEFTVNASDADGDTLTFSVSNLPAGAVFDPGTRTFSWTPGFNQAGIYPEVFFQVSDGVLTDSENITITVNNISLIAIIEVAAPSECIGLNKQFDVQINVNPMGASIYGIEYELSFNSTVVHAKWQDDGDFMKQGGVNTNVYVNNIDNLAGKASFAVTRTGTSIGATEPGTFATIHFTAIQMGANTTLDLSTIKASDPDTLPISMDIINSEVEVCDNKPPVVIGKTKFKYNNQGTKYMSKTYFDSSGSNDPNGNIINYQWYFGDGNYGSGETVEYIYGSWMWNTSTHSYDPFTTILTVEDDGVPMMDNSTKIPVNVYIAGDANGDGEVDIFDATLVGIKWDAVCGPDGWDTDQKDQADLNNDCAIDIFDAVIIGANWDNIAW